jgi:hypothetical protein
LARRLLDAARMGSAMFVIVLIFAVPLGLTIWYFAIHKPKQGRIAQERVWKPLADRLGGRWMWSPGGAQFHMMNIQVRDATVAVSVHDRVAVDPEIKEELPLDIGGWRTFVHADTRWPGAPMSIEPRQGRRDGLAVGDPAVQQHHLIRPLRGSHPAALHGRLTPDVCHALAMLGQRYIYLAVGPRVVTLILCGDACHDPGQLEAAIYVVGSLAATPIPQSQALPAAG